MYWKQIKTSKGGEMMERLTKTYSDGTHGANDNLPCGENSYTYKGLLLEALGKYEDADEQGLLLRLPCKVGDTIYVNGILGVGKAEEYKAIRVDYHSNLATKRSEFYIEALLVSAPENSIGFYDKEIGKTVFLTKEEAEQKLKEMNTDNGIAE